MRRLFPIPGPSDVVADADLPALYAPPARTDDQPWVRANMISSLDGSAHGPDGLSGSLGTARDASVLALLRAQADVVVVGGGTVRAEGYGPVEVDARFAHLRTAVGKGPTAPIAVVSRDLDLDPDATLFTAAPSDARTLVVTGHDAPGGRRADLEHVADVVVAGQNGVDPHRLIDALAERGHRQILTEGGPHLLRDLTAADVVDELCLTIALRTIGGDAGRILSGAPTDPHDWQPHLLILDEDILLGRWFRTDDARFR